MGSVGTGSVDADSPNAGCAKTSNADAGSVDADSTNEGRERLARYA
jgi:hypothetical protein